MPQFMPDAVITATNVYHGTQHQLALGLNLPDPNAHSCTRRYGHPIPPACRTALKGLPHGELPTIFTTRKHGPGDNFVTLPQQYSDTDKSPACVITIELDGHSKKDVFVSVPWNTVQNIAEGIIERCVDGPGMGGWETFGIQDAFDAVINPVMVNPIPGSAPVGVANPDGLVTSVGVPENSVTDPDPPSIEIPSYLLVTVAAPRARPRREKTDFSISLNLREYLRQKYESSTDIDAIRDIARAAEALNHPFIQSLHTYNHPRWWEFKFGPEMPEPTNVDYSCDAKLGNPAVGSCEAVLYEFLRNNGKVVLDPAAGPVIKQSGNCAIGIASKVRQVVSWEMLRSVAETLIMTCVASPTAAAVGGKAVARPIRSGRRRRFLPPFFSKRDTATDTLPLPVEMSVYLQPSFSGAPYETCPWKVVSSHQGDVRQCPAKEPPTDLRN